MNPLAGSRAFAFAAVAASSASLLAQRPLHERVNAALEKARPALTAHLENFVQAPDAGHLGLLSLAAVHDGMDPTKAPLKDALAKLVDADTDQTYALSLRILVAEACPQFPDRETRSKKDLKALLRNRHEGGFGYSPHGGNWDLSNTQYAVLGLRAATAIGHEVAKETWSSIAAAVARTNHGHGFTYTPDNNGPTLSMTAAGLAVLSICQQQLEARNSTLPKATLERRERGWQWIADHKDGIGKKNTPHCYYFHYGLLRAAVLDDKAEIDGLDWYERGATMLLEEQGAGGGWGQGRDTGLFGQALAGGEKIGQPVDTAFAVLFLCRKFQKHAGPVTGARTITLPMLDAKSTDADVKNCGEYLGKRGKAAMVEILTALRADVTPRRRAALLGLAAIAGQDFGIDASKDASANSEALRKAELWYLKNR